MDRWRTVTHKRGLNNLLGKPFLQHLFWIKYQYLLERLLYFSSSKVRVSLSEEIIHASAYISYDQ